MFIVAVQNLVESGLAVSEVIAYERYRSQLGLPKKNPVADISVQTFAGLSSELKEHGCMVFRLGARSGFRGTTFCLAKYKKDWGDFFLFDSEIFGSSPVEVYLPQASIRSLFAYQLLPKLTETSLVNLAVASGLLQHALGLSTKNDFVVPATCQSTFSFEFRPISGSNTVVQHENGQVEIDGMFMGNQNGVEKLFLIEAKTSTSLESLSKTKLLYPYLSLKNKVPKELEIVPVYLRVIPRDGCLEFNVAQCVLSVPDGSVAATDSLQVDLVKRYLLLGYN